MDYMETIKVDMYAAMKSGDKDKAGALRTLFAKLKDKQINARKDLTEKECISVIKTLVSEYQMSGPRIVPWNGTTDSGKIISAGVYLYRFNYGQRSQTKKMIFLK